MTLLRPMPITGSILDIRGPVFNAIPINARTGHVADKMIVKQTQNKAVQPLSLGAERHGQMISALKDLKGAISQNVTQIQDALPQNRDWRL